MTATENSTTAVPEQHGPRVYYSRNANLNICINKGEVKTGADGRTITVGHKIAEFRGQANGFGQLITDDPETIDNLDRRMAVVGDVFEPLKYNDLITPDAVKIKMALNERDRLLTDNNRLLNKLEEMNRELVAARKK